MDIESVMDPEADLVIDPDVKPVTELMDEQVMNPVDKPDMPHWEIPTLCSTCVKVKQHVQVIHTKVPQSSTLFALVHSDLCGPMKHSIGGTQYYIIYIDDYTRYTEVYFLITKNTEEILAKFQHYQAWVETQGFHIKHFRSDNGSGEYNNSIFLGLLGEKGITFELSPLYTQHKNRTAERIIRTLNAKA